LCFTDANPSAFTNHILQGEKNMTGIENFKIIEISTRTANTEGKSEKDLHNLWGQFLGNHTAEKIPNSTGPEVIALYTDYESDYTGEYTCIIGLKVSSLETIPNGMVGREVKGGRFQKYIAKGSMPKAVAEKWINIWDKDHLLNRAYKTDFEVYGHLSNQGEDSEVQIFLSVN